MKKILYRFFKNRFFIYIKYDNVINLKYIYKVNIVIINNISFFLKLIYVFIVIFFFRISNWIFIFCIL